MKNRVSLEDGAAENTWIGEPASLPTELNPFIPFNPRFRKMKNCVFEEKTMNTKEDHHEKEV